MKVVVDTSVLFSALLKEENTFAERILLEDEISFFTPRYAIVEIFKHKEKIVQHSKCSEEVLLEAKSTNGLRAIQNSKQMMGFIKTNENKC